MSYQEEMVVTPTAPFGGESWTEKQPEQIQQPENKETVKEPETVVENKQTVEEKPIVQEQAKTEPIEDVWDEAKYLKENFGFDSPEVAKEEIKKLREKKDYEFKNDDSRKLAEYINEGKVDDLYGFLSTKKKVEKLIKADVTDTNVAAELVKFGIQNDNPSLDESEIEFMFNEKYGLPPKPVQAIDELDSEFEARELQWQQQKQSIEKKLVIEAKIAKPKLEQLNTELVLPDIKKDIPSQSPEALAEEQQRLDSIRTNYLSVLESDFKNFNGYDLKYKDEEVEIPVSFVVSDEEKSALKNELTNFDVDAFIISRWFTEEGKPNITQMMDDVTLLRNKEKVFQKMINEVGTQMKLHYMGKKSNVNVTGAQQTFTQDGNKSNFDKQVEFLWNQK